MSLLGLLIFLIGLGVILWLVFKYVHMPKVIRALIIVVMVIVVIVWLLEALGACNGLTGVRIR